MVKFSDQLFRPEVEVNREEEERVEKLLADGVPPNSLLM